MRRLPDLLTGALVFGSMALMSLPAAANWTALNGELNEDPNENAGNPALATAQIDVATQLLYTSYSEYVNSFSRTHVFVKIWNGTDWETVPGSGAVPLNNNPSNNDAGLSRIAVTQGSSTTPYVAFAESGSGDNHVFVKRHTGGSGWDRVGNTLNAVESQIATNPDIALGIGGMQWPVVVWNEDAGNWNIYAKRFDGASWESLPPAGTPLDRTAANSATLPRIVMPTNNQPVVAWQEDIGGGLTDIFVSRYNGASWNSLRNGLKDGGAGISGVEPDIAISSGDIPYVTFLEGAGTSLTVKVKRWVISDWQEILPSPAAGEGIGSPRVTITDDDRLYVAYKVSSAGPSYRLRVEYYNGVGWEDVGTNLNFDPTNDYYLSDLESWGNQPAATWNENIPAASSYHVFVKHWVPPPTATPTFTPIATSTYTSTPTVELTPTPDLGGVVENNQAVAYPLPASSRVTFAFQTDDGTGDVVIRVYNTHYRLVETLTGQAPTGAGQLVWDVSGTAPGVYFYQVTVGSKKLDYQKLVIAR